MIAKLTRVLLVLWTGSLWSLFWVTWAVFRAQGDRHVAGLAVGPLFSIETYLGMAVALAATLSRNRSRIVWVYAATVLLAVNEWPLRLGMRAARDNGSSLGLSFGGWHGLSMVLYVSACLAMLRFVWVSDQV